MLAKVSDSINASLDLRNEANGWARLKCRAYYTPDFSALRKQSQILFFSWGRENDDLWKFLKGSISLGACRTLANKYVMREDDYGPMVFEKKRDEEDTLLLRGTAHLVSIEHIHSLDVMYLNTVLTTRVERMIGLDEPGMSLMTPERFKGKPRARAWMYVASKTSYDCNKYGKLVPPMTEISVIQHEPDTRCYLW